MKFDERLLEVAEQFYLAAEDCGRIDLAHRHGVWLACPELVNYACAAEQALAGLVWLHVGQPPDGHDLYQLCSALPPSLFAEMTASTLTDAESFDSRLQALRFSLRDWRFAYESEELGVSIAFLANLAVAAIEALRRGVALAVAEDIRGKLGGDRADAAPTAPPMFESRAKRLVEIRLGRSAEVRAITDGGWPEGELWAPDNPELRRELELLVKVGNRLFGSESHWIEEREA